MKLTDWEAGQELIKCADALGLAKVELRDSHKDLSKMLETLQRTVGDHFNKLGSHDFGLLDSLSKEKK